MLRIAVCDDDPTVIEQIFDNLTETLGELAIPFLAECCSSGEELLLKLHAGKVFDIIYMDICMEGMNGIEVAKKLRVHFRNRKILLIFISSYEDRVKELFECDTFRFLEKPIRADKFAKYLKDACDCLALKGRQHLEFKEIRGDMMSVPYDEIIYLESSGRIVNLVTEEKKYQFYGKLGQIAPQFEASGFIRIHNSILVNIIYISSIRYEAVTLSNGETKDISGPKRKQVRETYMKIRKRRGI